MRVLTSSREFNEVVRRRGVVVVVFTSSSCPACMMYRPVVEEASKLLRGLVDVYEYLVDYDPEPALELGVMGTPTTIVFIDGKPVDGFVGYVDLGGFCEFLESVLERMRPEVARAASRACESITPSMWM